MKRQVINDERILIQKRKIGSDAFQLLFYGLLVSIIIQEFVFKAPFSQYAVEYICFFSSSLYILVRNLLVGNSIFRSGNNGRNLIFINCFVFGLTVTAINTILNYMKLGDLFTKNIANTIMVAVGTFVCSTIVAFLVFGLFYLINKKRQDQIEAKLMDEDTDKLK